MQGGRKRSRVGIAPHLAGEVAVDSEVGRGGVALLRSVLRTKRY